MYEQKWVSERWRNIDTIRTQDILKQFKQIKGLVEPALFNFHQSNVCTVLFQMTTTSWLIQKGF